MLSKHKQIQEEYLDYITFYSSSTPITATLKFIILLKLNFKHFIKNKLKKFSRFSYLSPEYISHIALNYDVISFDIFDTLLFRLVCNPYDVFLLMESKYNFKNFSALRIKAESNARGEKNHNKKKEVSLQEIYTVFAEECIINPQEWFQREIDMERSLLVPNQDMIQVFDTLIAAGKTIILTSDMYIPAEILKDFVFSNGYTGITKFFVSCDYGVSKKDGGLYKKIKRDFPNQKILHIGDNKNSDVHKPHCYQIDSLHYLLHPETLLCDDKANMSRLIRSIYCGILHSQMNKLKTTHTEYYNYGFSNGGILVCGYCQWLNKLAKEKKIDKILFLSRDGFIIHEIYNSYFKEFDNEYIYFSRFCSEQILFKSHMNDYIEKNIQPRFDDTSTITFRDLLLQLDLTFLEKNLGNYNLDISEKLTRDNFQPFITLFKDSKNTVITEMEKTQLATLQYLSEKIRNKQRILIVDVGWYATGYTAIKQLIETTEFSKTQIYGALIGTREGRNIEAMLTSGYLSAYCFSPMHNTELLHWHNLTDADIHDALVELLFTSTEPSFLKYILTDSGEIESVFSQSEQNETIIHEIHKGIKAFSYIWTSFLSKASINLYISGKDAYMPIMDTMKNKKYCYELFENFKTTALSGNYKGASLDSLGALMRKKHYIKGE